MRCTGQNGSNHGVPGCFASTDVKHSNNWHDFCTCHMIKPVVSFDKFPNDAVFVAKALIIFVLRSMKNKKKMTFDGERLFGWWTWNSTSKWDPCSHEAMKAHNHLHWQFPQTKQHESVDEFHVWCVGKHCFLVGSCVICCHLGGCDQQQWTKFNKNQWGLFPWLHTLFCTHSKNLQWKIWLTVGVAFKARSSRADNKTSKYVWNLEDPLVSLQPLFLFCQYHSID